MVFSFFRWGKARPKRPALDVSVFELALRTGGEDVHLRLAEQLVSFMADDKTPEEERALVRPVLLKLATGKARAVRARLAELAAEHGLEEPELIFSIVADEDDIAVSFIEAARRLSGTVQLAILRAGDSLRRKAVCSRHDVAPEVVREVVEQGERSLILALLANEHAILPASLARQLYIRWREDEDVIAALLKRTDLPLEVRIAHVEISAGRLREVMAQADWASAARAVEAAAGMEEQALVDILADAAGDEQLLTALEFLSRRGKLTAGVLLRAACAGHVAVLVQALAWLARMKPARLAAALEPEAALGVVRTALAKSGLSPQAHPLALGVFLAARREGAAAAEVGRQIPGFGPRVLEALADTDLLSVTEKIQAANLLQRVGDETTRELAARFVQSLLRHAA